MPSAICQPGPCPTLHHLAPTGNALASCGFPTTSQRISAPTGVQNLASNAAVAFAVRSRHSACHSACCPCAGADAGRTFASARQNHALEPGRKYGNAAGDQQHWAAAHASVP